MATKGSCYVEVQPGVRVWVDDVGEGRPLVFIHGWPASRRMFEYQCNELPKNGVRCICPDTRGFGWSDKPWDGYTYDRLADDLKAVLDFFELEDATLAGFSMGGAIAVRYVTRHSATRVGRLALLGAAVPCVTRSEDFQFGIDRSACDDLIKLAYRDRPQMIARFAETFFHDPDALSAEFRAWFSGICTQAAGHATIKCAELFRDADLRDELREIEIPTMILHGESDKICAFEIAEQTHDGIAGSSLVRIPNAGHGFFYEEHNRVNDELLQFLERSAPAALEEAGMGAGPTEEQPAP